jgi:hypothetical protein
MAKGLNLQISEFKKNVFNEVNILLNAGLPLEAIRSELREVYISVERESSRAISEEIKAYSKEQKEEGGGQDGETT